jgi:hypothetical protein
LSRIKLLVGFKEGKNLPNEASMGRGESRDIFLPFGVTVLCALLLIHDSTTHLQPGRGASAASRCASSATPLSFCSQPNIPHTIQKDHPPPGLGDALPAHSRKEPEWRDHFTHRSPYLKSRSVFRRLGKIPQWVAQKTRRCLQPLQAGRCHT